MPAKPLQWRWLSPAGQAGGHFQVRRLARRDAPAIGKQRASVLERHDAVAEQAPSLFGMRRHNVGRLTIRCVRGRAGRSMLAHDAPRSCCRALPRQVGSAASALIGEGGSAPKARLSRTQLIWDPNPGRRRTAAVPCCLHLVGAPGGAGLTFSRHTDQRAVNSRNPSRPHTPESLREGKTRRRQHLGVSLPGGARA